MEIGVRDGELKEIDEDFGGKKRGILLRILRVLPRSMPQQRVQIAIERVPPLLPCLDETPFQWAH